MIKKKVSEFSVEEMQSYRAIPATKKLEFLVRMTAFLNRVTSKKSRKVAEILKKKNY